MESGERSRLPFVVAEVVQHESAVYDSAVDESVRVEALDRIEALFSEILSCLLTSTAVRSADSVLPHLLRCCARFLARDSTFLHKSLAIQVLKTMETTLRNTGGSGGNWEWLISLTIAVDKIQHVCADSAVNISALNDELREAALDTLTAVFANLQPTDESAVSDAVKHAAMHALQASIGWTQLPGLIGAALQSLRTQTEVLRHWPSFLRQTFPGLFSGLTKVCTSRATLRHRADAFLLLMRVLTAAAHREGDERLSWFTGDAPDDAGAAHAALQLVRAAQRSLQRDVGGSAAAAVAQRDDALLAWRVDVLQRVSRVLVSLLMGLLHDCAQHGNGAHSLALQRQVAATVLDAVYDRGDFLGATLSAELLTVLCERLDAAVDDGDTGDVPIGFTNDAWLQRRLLRCVGVPADDCTGRAAFRRALQGQLAQLWRDRWHRLGALHPLPPATQLAFDLRVTRRLMGVQTVSLDDALCAEPQLEADVRRALLQLLAPTALLESGGVVQEARKCRWFAYRAVAQLGTGDLSCEVETVAFDDALRLATGDDTGDEALREAEDVFVAGGGFRAADAVVARETHRLASVALAGSALLRQHCDEELHESLRRLRRLSSTATTRIALSDSDDSDDGGPEDGGDGNGASAADSGVRERTVLLAAMGGLRLAHCDLQRRLRVRLYTRPPRQWDSGAPPRRRCGFCERPTATGLRCGRCRAVFYCDAAHQRQHWAAHKVRRCRCSSSRCLPPLFVGRLS